MGDRSIRKTSCFSVRAIRTNALKACRIPIRNWSVLIQHDNGCSKDNVDVSTSCNRFDDVYSFWPFLLNTNDRFRYNDTIVYYIRRYDGRRQYYNYYYYYASICIILAVYTCTILRIQSLCCAQVFVLDFVIRVKE